jgi:methionyl-tRNA synthetase
MESHVSLARKRIIYFFYQSAKSRLNICCQQIQINGKQCEPCKEENNLFFLSKCQKSLEYFLSANPNFVQPPYHLNEVQRWVKGGLKKLLILSGDG